MSQETTRMRGTRTDLMVTVGLTALAGLLRLIRIGTPAFNAGDERFYVNDACWYLFSSGDVCDVAQEMNLEHPPLGKWIIAASMSLFGDTIVGQRLLVALIGTATVPLVYLLARKLLRSRLGAAVAAGLLAVDFTHFVLSRAAMLDVPLVFFAVLAFLAMARAREEPEPGDLRWRCLAGAATGAAIATKWTGVLVLLSAVALAYTWDLLARRGPHERHPVIRAVRQRGAGWLLAFVLVPAIVYSFTFIGRVHGDVFAWPWSDTSWLSALWERQLTTFEFHSQHIWSHRYASEPWAWPLAKRGFVMAGNAAAGRLVVATGNPIVWSAGLSATLYVGFRWLRERRARSAEAFLLTTVALSYLPWFVYLALITWGRESTFIFYFLPTVPLIYIALGYAAARASRARIGRMVVAVGTAAVLAMFAFYYPLMTFVRLTPDQLDARLFAFDDCEVAGQDFVVLDPTTLPNGRITYDSKVAPPAWYTPPDGWCWL